MLNVSRPTPSHFGIYVFDVDKMVTFYTSVFGLVSAKHSRHLWSF